MDLLIIISCPHTLVLTHEFAAAAIGIDISFETCSSVGVVRKSEVVKYQDIAYRNGKSHKRKEKWAPLQ